MNRLIRHRTTPHVFRLLALLLLSFSGAAAQAAGTGAPLGLLLTWQSDPLTTMTIDWHTEEEGPPAALEFRSVGQTDWRSGPAPASSPFPHSGRFIHRVELTGLEPGTTYEFRVSEGGRIYRFRTMPRDLSRPLRFATGGDVRHSQAMMERTNRALLPYDPDFIVWGGDLAYADGRPDRVERWYEFMDAIKRTLVTVDGRVIPILAAIGNHEVRGGYWHNSDEYAPGEAWQREFAPFYYSLFAFPGHPGYGALDFGDYLSIVLLDTDHSGPIEGEQTAWLDRILGERREVPHVFPTYHVPAYPSVRNPEGSGHQRVREHWVPLFERHGLRLVFEAHDHAYKRTHPIREGRVHPGGVVYVGDGAWGVSTREIGRSHREGMWYLDQGHADRHFILVTLHGPHQHLLVVNEDGRVIDEYPATPRP
jgi:acid phosphatase type 7